MLREEHIEGQLWKGQNSGRSGSLEVLNRNKVGSQKRNAGKCNFGGGMERCRKQTNEAGS